MALTKLEKNKVYADGFELGYVGTVNPKKVRVRFFPQFITTHNHQTSVTQKQTLKDPILIAQVYDGTGWPINDRSVWAPHPREWFAVEQLTGGVGTPVYSPAHTADEIQYFANNAKFLEINWKSADGSANQDPRHFGNETTQKEGEQAVSGLFFLINESGTVIRVDKDGKPLNPDGTYVNAADDPSKTPKTVVADDDSTTSTLWDKVKQYGPWVGGGILVLAGGAWVIKKLTPKKSKKK